ncbi:MAG: hypothetical protein ACOX6M_03575 [Armatimonadota bacterium]
MYRSLWVIAALFGVSAVLSVCLSACAGAGAPSVPPIDDGAGPTRITVRFDMSMGADASARGVTAVVNGVQLESDPLSMNWDGSVLSGDVRVNNVSTGSTMKDIEARIFSVNPPDMGIGWNDQEWNYKSAAEGLSSSFVNWAFSGSGGADFEFVVEVSWTPVPAKIAWVSDRHREPGGLRREQGWHESRERLELPRRRRRLPLAQRRWEQGRLDEGPRRVLGL